MIRSGMIMNYLVANLHDITLKQIAAHFGYQPKYLSRLIKQLFNQTFTQSVGKSLLELTTKSIEEISEIVGYPTVSTYYRAFRQETGQTLNEYRKRRQANSAARTNLVALLLLKLQFQLGARSRNLMAANQPTIASCLTAA